jgi:hypothetical protein
MSEIKRFVMVRGGFAGVTLAQRLKRLLPTQMEAIVYSAENHLVFTPMLPEVVGRTVSPERRRGRLPVDPAHQVAGGAPAEHCHGGDDGLRLRKLRLPGSQRKAGRPGATLVREASSPGSLVATQRKKP